MSNHYKDAIELLKNLSPEKSKEIIFEIAKQNPSAVVKAIPQEIESASDLKRSCKELICSCVHGRKIDAIKEIRYLTGLSLKEAKCLFDSCW